MREDFVLGDQSRRRVLGHHQAGVDTTSIDKKSRESRKYRVQETVGVALGEVGYFRHRDTQEIDCHAQRLAMKIAAGQIGVVIWEKERIVGRGVHLGFDLGAHVETANYRWSQDLRR